ncbi:MAG: hypothetical protein RRB13_02190 [bacterium]|nr:hypothetical protein [bacterium]
MGAVLTPFLVPSLKAQVATPSLDPSEPLWAAPAIGWRAAMTLQLAASNHDGSTYNSSGTLTFENSRKTNEFLATLFWKDLRLEGSGVR